MLIAGINNAVECNSIRLNLVDEYYQRGFLLPLCRPFQLFHVEHFTIKIYFTTNFIIILIYETL